MKVKGQGEPLETTSASGLPPGARFGPATFGTLGSASGPQLEDLCVTSPNIEKSRARRRFHVFLSSVRLRMAPQPGDKTQP